MLGQNRYKLIYSFAKLIRIENLFLIALVLYVSNQYIYNKEQFALPFNLLLVLILGTVCIAAGGYVINDYFDLKIDKINRPNEVVLERDIHRRAAILWHLFFSLIGLASGVYLAFKVGRWSIAIIQLITIMLLLIYSNVLKRVFILGNITIALLSGILPMLPYIYAKVLNPQLSILTTNALISLSAFAFFTTLIREMIKDIEDMKGDRSGGRRTIPVVWGFLASKIIVFFLLLLLIIFLLPFLIYYSLNHNVSAVLYNVLLLILPAVISMIMLIVIKEPRQFKILSLIMKLIMLAGIIFYLIF